MNRTNQTGEYMLLFRGTDWHKKLSPEDLEHAMDKVMAWFESLKEQGKVKAGQPLGVEGRTVSGRNGRTVADGPFAESKEAVGGYLLLQVDNLDEATTIAKSNPMLEYGIAIEVRPVLEECPAFQHAKGQLLSKAAA